MAVLSFALALVVSFIVSRGILLLWPTAHYTRWWILWLWFCVFNVIDAATSGYMFLTIDPEFANEGNPIAAWFFRHLGLWPSMAVKTIVAPLALLYLFREALRKPPSSIPLFVVVVVAITAINGLMAVCWALTAH